jgi:hypothetical protein
MKLNILAILTALTLATAGGNCFAETAGDKANVYLNYDQINVDNGPTFSGFSLGTDIPLGKTTTVTPLKWTLNVEGVSSRNNDSHASVSSLKGGLTMKFTEWNSLQPYFSFGVQSNYGNFVNGVEDYFAYYVEPGVRVNVQDWGYVFASYQYGASFKSASIGSVRNMPIIGAGVNLTKNLGIEARYEMNQGSYNYDRLVAGVNYKF